MMVAYLGQSSVERISAFSTALTKRGLTVGTLTESAMAEIAQELPPIEPPFGDDILPTFLTGITEVPPASWWDT